MPDFRFRLTTRRALALSLMACTSAQAQMQCEPPLHDCPPTELPQPRPDPADKFPLIDDGKLKIDLRSVSDSQSVDKGIKRHAWTLNMQASYESGYTSGPVGFGVDIAPFVATRIDGSDNAGNMAHVRPDGHSADDRAWAYLGKYAVKARVGDTVVKYGLQRVSNPVLESKDNRGLPPTFRGATITSVITPSLNVEAGDFDAAIGRGRSTLKGLSTEYGGTPFKRIAYAGANWDYSETGSLSVYANQASDVWNQSYASVTQSVGNLATVQWTGAANAYLTHNQGASLQGPIDSKAYSLSLSAAHGPLTIMAAYQQVLSDQFFDDVNDAWGIALVNAVAAADYNAPHEQSAQLRVVVDGASLGVPGLKLISWVMTGWGTDGRNGAGQHASPSDPQYTLYWVDGRPAGGNHHEIGAFPTYTLQEGRFKGTKIGFFGCAYKVSKRYPDSGIHEYKFQLDMPIQVF
ncbi:OprD family outer membrane porin [Ideonella sp.]|uniref:OprD family outer membrane porin n=1 Tax=Ideonella sp. TaxID=1929293 RepID=UPI00351B38AF